MSDVSPQQPVQRSPARPPVVLLVGLEVDSADGVVFIRTPTLLRRHEPSLPTAVEFGVALMVLDSSIDRGEIMPFQLRVARPSETVALSLTGLMSNEDGGAAPLWTQSIRLVLDEAGPWVFSAEIAGRTAEREIVVTTAGDG
ncbi:hypothetical protein FZ103_20830 [Streptomonospora sp. PA3]|uniref:hypothetical protein n=1 Tax=Streptomonospora sp. PA3 TaxID=2607326 RepID=UPI0012DDD8CE|nr:hypothetical protein [Streptomonospora sp. PA3]MUL43585.1 hypothetical protein [Streptomonospora sp. PA3]